MSVQLIGRYGTAAAIRSRAASATPSGGRRRLRPGATPKPLAALRAGELAALANARTAIAAAGVSIANPILDRAVVDGVIDAAQRAAFVECIRCDRGSGAGPDGTWRGASGAVRGLALAAAGDASAAVFATAQAAIQARVPTIAKPILDAAVAGGTISASAETMLLHLLCRELPCHTREHVDSR
jgi:hypothetical protein